MPTEPDARRARRPENPEAVVGAIALAATLVALAVGTVAAVRGNIVVPIATYGPLVAILALVTVFLGHHARRGARRTGSGRRLSTTVVALGWLVLLPVAPLAVLSFVVLGGIAL